MELHHDPHSFDVHDLAFSKVSEALLDPMQHDRSQNQTEIDDVDDIALLLDQDSYRTHITETQIDELDIRPQRSTTDPREHSPVDSIANAPFRSTSQQRHVKAIFTRPVSAEGDIQTGFTFKKAPPPKALDLTGARKLGTSATTKPDDSMPPQSPESTLNCSQVQQKNGSHLLASDACNSHQARPNFPPSSRSEMLHGDSNTQMRIAAPQNHAESELSQELDEHTLDNARHGTPSIVQVSQSAIPKDILPILRTASASSAAKATQLGTAQQENRSEPEAGRLPSPTRRDGAGIDSIPLDKETVTGNITGSPLRQLRPTHIAHNGTHMSTTRSAQESIQPGRKVTKRKSITKKQSAPGKAPVQSVEAMSAQGPATSIAVAPPTDEEQLLEALWQRYRNQSHERKIEQSQLESAATGLKRTQEANGTLQTRLHEIQHRAERQQAELNDNESKMAVWRMKLSKLTDHINGLSKDHVQLKQDSICIRNQQEEISKDKVNVDLAMREVHKYVKDGNLAELAEVKTEAEHRIRLLEQTVENQERQLQEDWDLLRAERERNLRLEAEMVKFSDKHDELMKDVVAHRQTMSNQLSELLTTCETRQVASNSDNDIQVRTQLEECTNLIKELRDSETVTPSDFQKLNSCVRNYAEHITATIERNVLITRSAGTGQQTFESEVQSKLDSLSAGVKSEQTLSEQVADLRELKATIRERLQATEVALAEARQHSHGLQQKEQLLQQKILDLEVETATLRSQPTENFLAVLRQKELEDKNKQLLADIIKAHEDAREAAELSQRQAQSLAEQSEQIDCLNSQLEAVRAALTTLGDEKSASERRAAERCDEVRDQVLKAANVEKTNILNAHANTLRQLKYQKDEADSRAEELSCQLTALKNAEGNKNQTSSNLRAQCANLEIRNAEKDSRLASLQEELRHAAGASQSKDAELGTLREAKAILTKEVQSKDAELEALSKTNSDLVQEHASAKENSEATASGADVKAAQTLAEVQVLLKSFDENLVLVNTLADATALLSQVLMCAKKDGKEVSDESIVANPKGILSSDFKASDTASGSPHKPRRRANRGAAAGDSHQAVHTDESECHSGVVVQQSQIEETTFHSRNVKTTSSSLGTDKSHITPFSQIRQIESAVPPSPLGDVSELFPPTPINPNAQQNYPPLRAVQRPSHGSREEQLQSDENRESSKSRPTRRTSVQNRRLSSSQPSHGLDSKRIPDRKPRTPNAGKPITPQADKESICGGRNAGFDDPAAGGAASGRMKISRPQVRTASSSQVPASPRGILKDPNTLKRSAAAAGFKTTGSNSRAGKNMKVSESQRNSLGPIIGDSQQSPQKPPRRNTRRKQSKDQEYSDRFSQELR